MNEMILSHNMFYLYLEFYSHALSIDVMILNYYVVTYQRTFSSWGLYDSHKTRWRWSTTTVTAVVDKTPYCFRKYLCSLNS